MSSLLPLKGLISKIPKNVLLTVNNFRNIYDLTFFLRSVNNFKRTKMRSFRLVFVYTVQLKPENSGIGRRLLTQIMTSQCEQTLLTE